MKNSIEQQHTHLILGGARSGKSSYAEQLLKQYCSQRTSDHSNKVYIATATADDAEMQQRINLHQQQRGSDWQLVEEPVNLAHAIQQYNDTDQFVLIDCLTLWLSNCLHQKCWLEQREAFLAALSDYSGTLLMVSNEVGSGIVPMGELSRQFVDESGWLHQTVSKHCSSVTLVIAGLPLHLKQTIKEG